MQPLEITLEKSKETKGTFVYAMKNEVGVLLGSVYLPKLVLPNPAPDKLKMVISAS